MLWYDPDSDFSSNPDAVRRCEIEAHGGPVLPVLDFDTREAIETLLATAEHWGRDWFAWTNETTWPGEHNGEPIELHYDGDLRELIVPDALAATIRAQAELPGVAASSAHQESQSPTGAVCAVDGLAWPCAEASGDQVSLPDGQRPTYDELRDFVTAVARLSADGDPVTDPGRENFGEAYELENDDAVATVNGLVAEAQQLLGIAFNAAP